MVWQKGQSGNPSGRPQSRPITQAILAELGRPHKGGGTRLEAVATRLVNIVLHGERTESVAAAKLLLGYTDGQPLAQVDVGGEVTVQLETARRLLRVVGGSE